MLEYLDDLNLFLPDVEVLLNRCQRCYQSYEFNPIIQKFEK